MTEVLKSLVLRITFFDYSEMENKGIDNKELLLFYEWSNAVRISQEPNRSKVSRMRKKVNEIYLKYSTNKKANELMNKVEERLNESLRCDAPLQPFYLLSKW